MVIKIPGIRCGHLLKWKSWIGHKTKLQVENFPLYVIFSDGLLIRTRYDSVIRMLGVSDGSVMILGDCNGQRKLTKCTIKNGKVVCDHTVTTPMEQAPTDIADCRLQGKNRLAVAYRFGTFSHFFF